MTKKAAILGTAPSSLKYAPVDDPSWEIWGILDLYKKVARCDRWFELHDIRWISDKDHPEFQSHYFEVYEWMQDQDIPIYLREKHPKISTSVAYPLQDMVNKFGSYFFTSTIAWEIALAIYEGYDEIGLWGIDMSQQDEYAFQRPGCHHFIQVAKHMGIKVTIGETSDLVRTPPLYGFEDESPMARKLKERKAEISSRLDTAKHTQDQMRKETMYLQGALDDITYMEENWAMSYAKTGK